MNIYPCDPEKNDICKKTGCYWIGNGQCAHTKNSKFASSYGELEERYGKTTSGAEN